MNRRRHTNMVTFNNPKSTYIHMRMQFVYTFIYVYKEMGYSPNDRSFEFLTQDIGESKWGTLHTSIPDQNRNGTEFNTVVLGGIYDE